MSTKTTVARLEKTVQAKQGLCDVTYKVLRKNAPGESMTLERAFAEARRGVVKEIRFPLSFDEQEAEKRAGGDILSAMHDVLAGIHRDTDPPGYDTRLLLCSRPILYAQQAPVRHCNGYPMGGFFVTEDGEEFHQSQWHEMLKKRGCGFIVVKNYDETLEPWGTIKSKR